jgi:hypothetical protein
MKAKFVYSISFLFFVLTTVKGQKKIAFIKNETIKFQVLRKSMEFIDTNNIVPSKYLIRVDLNEKQQKEVKILTKEDWMKLLKGIHTDWAANLILYYMYERDAFLYYSFINNKERWRLTEKKNDIQYWSEHLK